MPCRCGACESCLAAKVSRRGVLGAMVGAATLATAQAASGKEPDPAAAIKALEQEAFAGLRAVFSAQKSFFAEKDRYTTSLDQCGFSPDEWCEDGARKRIKEKPTAFKKIGCHFIYEVETLGEPGQMQFRAHARGAVAPVLGIDYLVESSGEYAGVPRRNPK